VIARPFLGAPGAFTRTVRRKDYAVEPVGDTILDGMTARRQSVWGIGKISDIFCGRGVTHSLPTKSNSAGIDATIATLRDEPEARLIFTNLVDFDMLYGHRNDVEGFATALEYFDTRLPELLAALQDDDILCITADHGCDPTTPGTDHTREYVPLLVCGRGVRPGNLGTRTSLADLGASVYARLGNGAWPVGEKFF